LPGMSWKGLTMPFIVFFCKSTFAEEDNERHCKALP